MFNSDQSDYLKYLASLPRDKKCTCGWYRKGECHRCDKKAEDNTTKELTEQEAQKAYDEAPDVPLSKERISEIVRYATQEQPNPT